MWFVTFILEYNGFVVKGPSLITHKNVRYIREYLFNAGASMSGDIARVSDRVMLVSADGIHSNMATYHEIAGRLGKVLNSPQWTEVTFDDLLKRCGTLYLTPRSTSGASSLTYL